MQEALIYNLLFIIYYLLFIIYYLLNNLTRVS
jgi:hypothetical protein